LIQKKIQVLLINATHDGAVAVVEKAAKAGIPVITLQREIPTSMVISHIGTDNVVIGRMGAQWIVDKLGGKGNVVVMEGIPGADSSESRKIGSAEVFKKYQGIKIVAQQSGQYDRAKAMNVMENILQAQPKIDAVYCFNDEMAMGVLAAVKAAGRTGILITGMDANQDAVEAVKKRRVGNDNSSTSKGYWSLRRGICQMAEDWRNIDSSKVGYASTVHYAIRE